MPRSERPVFMALRSDAGFSVSSETTYLTEADEDE
jgi:hypothetical protein